MERPDGPRRTGTRLDGLTPRAATELQRRLAPRVRRTNAFERVETVAGLDLGVRDGRGFAAVCLLSFPALELLETRTAERELRFPYVPGLLAFREAPVLLEAFGRLERRPDLLLVDGHGLAHPRRFGIACFLGLELGLPTIGCGKSRLVGEHREPGPRRGSRTQLRHAGEVIGHVLRTRDSVRPVFVSIGHGVDLDTASRLVLRCARGYRLPEPTRHADRLAGSAGRARPGEAIG